MARIVIASSFVASSRVGGFAQALALAALRHEACVIPTVLFGRHPGLGAPGGSAVTNEVFAGVLQGAEANGALAEARMIITGYFASAEQVEAIAAAIDRTKPNAAPPIVLVDPILGDEQRGLYVKPEVEAAIRAHLISRADLIAPNLWELARLTGRTIATAEAAVGAARTLPCPVLVSSVPAGADQIGVLHVGSESHVWLAAHARAMAVPKGTGDLLTALYAAAVLEGETAPNALVRATGGVADAIENAIVLGRNDLSVIAGSAPASARPKAASNSAPWPSYPKRPDDLLPPFRTPTGRVRRKRSPTARSLASASPWWSTARWCSTPMAVSPTEKRRKPFDARTLTPVFSTTKAVAAILIARLVEAGRLDYAQPVADVWPEFAANGKAAITVEQAMSHQAGLPGFLEPMDPAEWFDWDAICARLAAMAPMWPPGTASGYHAITYGFLAGEIFRRVDGRTMGARATGGHRRAARSRSLHRPARRRVRPGGFAGEAARHRPLRPDQRRHPRRLPHQVGGARRAGRRRLAAGGVPLRQRPYDG